MKKHTDQDSFRHYLEFDDLPVLVNSALTPWASAFDGISKTLYHIGFDDLSEALKVYSSIDDLYRIPDYLDSSDLLGIDFKDGLSLDDFSSLKVKDATKDESANVVSDTTNAIDVNKVNQEFLEYLRTRTEEIASAIAHTDFEDGMDNDVTVLLRSFAKKNKSATYNWLDELYSKNLNNHIVVAGILRSLAMITEKGDENILLPIIVAGLRSAVSAEQEAAIMVIEEWRTKECLDAIRSVQSFASDIIEDYAMMVAAELEEELAKC